MNVFVRKKIFNQKFEIFSPFTFTLCSKIISKRLSDPHLSLIRQSYQSLPEYAGHGKFKFPAKCAFCHAHRYARLLPEGTDGAGALAETVRLNLDNG